MTFDVFFDWVVLCQRGCDWFTCWLLTVVGSVGGGFGVVCAFVSHGGCRLVLLGRVLIGFEKKEKIFPSAISSGKRAGWSGQALT